MKLKELDAALDEQNEELQSLGEPTLLQEEGVAARLYTGPMCVPASGLLCNPLHGPHAPFISCASIARTQVRTIQSGSPRLPKGGT